MTDADLREVRATLDAFVEGLRTLDWPSMREAFAADATAFFPFDEVPRRVEGIAAIEDAFRAFFATRAGASPLDVRPRDVSTHLAGDAAIVTFHLDRNASVGRRTLVLRRAAGQWRIAHLHASTAGGATASP